MNAALIAVLLIYGITEVWAVDFEFRSSAGDHVQPICMVARELCTGSTLRLWEDELQQTTVPPYSVGANAIFIAYFASAEMACHLALGWPMPVNVLDLYTEFRNLLNGPERQKGFYSLLGALAYFGLPGLDAVYKKTMQDLAIRGGPWTNEERNALIAYCETDVDALERLLPRLSASLQLPHALLRGRYMKAVAVMEANGVPIDVATLSTLREQWDVIKEHVINSVDATFGVFEGTSFKADRWAAWLQARDMGWPRQASGRLALDDDTFADMALSYPEIMPIRDVRCSLSQLRLNKLAVGSDGRNRCLLSPFSARTGRNQPRTSEFIFSPAAWIRGLIKPQPGFGIGYVDWSQQEFGIAAALSGDTAMLHAYSSGDPYLEFAKQAGAVPLSATKQTHGPERERFKACALGVLFGMEATGLARRTKTSLAHAEELLQLHKETYRTFWLWSDAAVDHAMLHGWLPTAFGWTTHVDASTNPRSIRNFPMQGNGAEMLRLACMFAIDEGIKVCAPVHDALLIEAPVESLDEAVLATQRAMGKASEAVLDGFSLRSEAKVVCFPERFTDSQGAEMWDTVSHIINIITSSTRAASAVAPDMLVPAPTGEATTLSGARSDTRAPAQQDMCDGAPPVLLISES